MLVGRSAVFSGLILVLAGATFAADKGSEISRLQGKWEVTKLVEDGKVIPKEAIQEWLPSGGRVEVIENAIIFTSPQDGKKYAKVFSLDPTRSPAGIDITTRDGSVGRGIYRFDDNSVVICIADPKQPDRPTEFSAGEGSKRMLMVLQRASQTPPKTAAVVDQAQKVRSDAAGKYLTDAQVKDMLKGTWRYMDDIGALFAIFDGDGSLNTVREVKELRLFQSMFVQTPVSTGRWAVQNGNLVLLIGTSTHPDRVNKQFAFAVRSISSRDLIFVDAFGRVGQAVRVR